MTSHHPHEPTRPPEQSAHADGHDRHNGSNGQNHAMGGMVQMAEQITQHYDEPAPHSEHQHPDPFPAGVMRGLGIGAVLGAVLGTIIGYLLTKNILVVPGWELMYSGAPATIYTLWIFLGVSLGVATIGVGSILRMRGETRPEQQPADEPHKAEPHAERERAVGG